MPTTPVRARVNLRGQKVTLETLTHLFAWLMIALAIWVSCLALERVAILSIQVFRLGLRVSRALRKLGGRRLKKIKREFAQAQERVEDEIGPKFELWWTETGEEIVKRSPALYQNVILPPGMELDELPEQMKAAVAGPALHYISQSVEEFAIHLASQPAHDAFIEAVRRINSKLATQYAEKYEAHLDDHRSQMADLGINIAEFEAQFSVAA